MENIKHHLSVALLTTAFILFGIILSPVLILNHYDHKIRIRKKPFYKSIIVRWAEKYPLVYEFYIFVMNFPMFHGVHRVTPQLRDDVLQVGCGTGALNLFLKKHRRTDNCRITNLDVNVASLEYGRRRRAFTEYLVSDILEVPLKDASFDIILFARSLHHIKNQKKAFKECSRLLKTGGLVVITDQVSESSKEPPASYMMNSNIDGLIWRYTEASLFRHLEKHAGLYFRVRSLKTTRQMYLANYNFVFPNSDVVAILEKIDS
jgi:ubiquinone/menaquinone biosynthesis C-methylase UbiE